MPAPTKMPEEFAQKVAQALADECSVPLHPDSLHDLAGPVNQVCTMLELFRKRRRKRPESDADAEDDELVLELMQTSATRLQCLMTALRTYRRVVDSPGEFRLCEGNALLASALASVEPMARNADALVWHDDLPALHCDPDQIIYALTSLVENSIKFRGQSRPEVRISATRNDLVAPQEDGWLFSVRDNGIGIDPRHSESVFHMFKRINGDRYAGAGAGLAITRRIIERHGGRIWFESALGSGATFFFTLPGTPRAVL
jgi:light-regulated signal transduction histidine kinase (bacteriophytochrome)